MNKNQNNDWNHHPNLPLKDTSIFGNMTSPKFLLSWFSKSWLSISEFVLLALLAIFLWAVCYPSLETAIHFQFNWIFQVLIVNFVVILCIAGGLHLYFYVYRMQDDKLKFDGREQARNNRSFLFSDQVKDNMFWSLSSGVLNITFFQVLTMWLMANGYIPAVSFNSLSIWFVLWFFFGFYIYPNMARFSFLLGASLTAYSSNV